MFRIVRVSHLSVAIRVHSFTTTTFAHVHYTYLCLNTGFDEAYYHTLYSSPSRDKYSHIKTLHCTYMQPIVPGPLINHKNLPEHALKLFNTWFVPQQLSSPYNSIPQLVWAAL
jgi:hypothetical protein